VSIIYLFIYFSYKKYNNLEYSIFPSHNFVENFKISEYKIISVKAAKVLEYTYYRESIQVEPIAIEPKQK
jgi:hypothetical protein